MTDSLPGSTLSRWQVRATIALLLAAVCASAFCRILELDIPWYLATGDEILRRGALPVQDPFSYTAHGELLIPKWLAAVTLALLYRVAGWAGVTLWQALLLALTIAALMWAQARRRGQTADTPAAGPLAGLSPLAYAAAAVLLRELVSPRAQAASNLIFALTLALILRDAGPLSDADGAPPRRRGRALYLTLPLSLLLAQLHGGNPHVFLLLALALLAAPSLRRAACAVAALALTCAGPYGVRVHEHFFAAPADMSIFREWQSLPTALSHAFPSLIGYVLFLVAAGVALIWRIRRGESLRLQTLVLAFYTAAAVRYVRFLSEAVLVATTVLAPALARLPRRLSPRAARWLPAAALTAALGVVALGAATSSRQLGCGLAPGRFPVAATEYLLRAQPPGPMFNSANFGGYLMWRYPRERVFADTRGFLAYSHEHMRELLAVYDDPRRFAALERRRGFRLAVVQRHGRSARLVTWLRRHPAWRLAHEDRLAAVFVRTR